MRVSDGKLAEAWDRGFAVVEGFLDAETLAAAREAMWTVFPKPEAHFAAAEAYPVPAAAVRYLSQLSPCGLGAEPFAGSIST